MGDFGKEDMYLFMESHKTMIELHTLVLSRLEKLVESNAVVNKNIESVITSTNKMTNKMVEFIESNNNLQMLITRNQSEANKAREEIKTQIHSGWVGMASIILLLILTFIM